MFLFRQQCDCTLILFLRMNSFFHVDAYRPGTKLGRLGKLGKLGHLRLFLDFLDIRLLYLALGPGTKLGNLGKLGKVGKKNFQ